MTYFMIYYIINNNKTIVIKDEEKVTICDITHAQKFIERHVSFFVTFFEWVRENVLNGS